MLVLSRKINERIVILLEDRTVEVAVLAVERNKVRLGVIAPADVGVHRQEVAQRLDQWRRTGTPAEQNSVDV